MEQQISDPSLIILVAEYGADIVGFALVKPMPKEAHVFVQNDADIMQTYLDHGAEPRRFGGKLMIPGVNDLGAGSRLAA